MKTVNHILHNAVAALLLPALMAACTDDGSDAGLTSTPVTDAVKFSARAVSGQAVTRADDGSDDLLDMDYNAWKWFSSSGDDGTNKNVLFFVCQHVYDNNENEPKVNTPTS